MNPSNKNLAQKIVITLLLYLIYRAGFTISLAGSLDPALSNWDRFLGQAKGFTPTLFAFGFMPALVGYFFVEIIFLLIPRLRKIRNQGLPGRKRVNQWGLALSLIIAGIQSWSLVKVWQMLSVNGQTLFDPSLLTSILYTGLLIFGFILVLLIGHGITKFGIGNGFCLLLAIGILEEAINKGHEYFQLIKINNEQANYIGFFFLFGLLFLIGKLIQKKDWKVEISNEKLAFIKVPFFLQSILPISYASQLISAPITLGQFFELSPSFKFLITDPITWSYSILSCFYILLASGLGYLLFSGRKRIASNLNLDASNIHLSLKPLVLSSLALAVLIFIFTMPAPFYKFRLIPFIIYLWSAFLLVAVVLDYWREIIFRNKSKDTILLFELSNVYLATALQQKLEEASIPHCIQGLQYRRLYYFWQPFIKMSLLINQEDVKTAQEILYELQVGYV